MTELEYRNNSGLNYSKLKLLDSVNPKDFLEYKEPETLYFTEKEHFNIGNAVDFSLTKNNSNVKFDDVFYTAKENVIKPSDAIKSILHQVWDITKNKNLKDEKLRRFILDCCVSNSYGSSYKEDTKINKIYECEDYYNELIASDNKIILSSKDRLTVDNIVSSFSNSSYLKNKFKGSLEIYKQLPILFKYKGLNCKALLDTLIYDESDTYTIIDYKTLGDNTLNFYKSFLRNKYWLQAVFYTEAVKNWLGPHIKIEFIFAVESSLNPGNPIFYKFPLEDEEFSKFYFTKLEELIDNYKYYLKNGFDTHRVIKENNNILNLKDYIKMEK